MGKVSRRSNCQISGPPEILFAFQHWCQGCHLHGFPTLQKLHAALSSKDVGFAVIQTVFEGTHENTFEVGVNQLRMSFLSFSVTTSNRPARRFQPSWKTTAHEELRGLRLSTLAVALFLGLPSRRGATK